LLTPSVHDSNCNIVCRLHLIMTLTVILLLCLHLTTANRYVIILYKFPLKDVYSPNIMLSILISNLKGKTDNYQEVWIFNHFAYKTIS
jgi:hypothetical protein